MSKISMSDLFRGAFHDLTHRPPGNIASLDALRSLAILLVFGGHASGLFQAPSWSHALFYFGWTGVDLFFVLSGFLIGGQLWKEVQRTDGIKIGRFLLRRGLRIWPLYFSFVLLMLAEALFAGRSALGVWPDALCVSNYFQGQVSGGWSLSTEEQFYILAPISLMLFLALKTRPRSLWIIPALGLVIPIVSRALVAASAPGTVSEGVLRNQLYFPFHTHSDGLAMGMLLAWLLTFHPKLFAGLRARWILAAILLTMGGIFYVASHVVFNFTALAFLYGAATFGGVAFPATSRILQWRGFYVISRLSYGIYLNHLIVLARLEPLLGHLQKSAQGFWICYLLSLAASIAFAALTFQLIEWPFLTIRARYQKKSASTPPV